MSRGDKLTDVSFHVEGWEVDKEDKGDKGDKGDKRDRAAEGDKEANT